MKLHLPKSLFVAVLAACVAQPVGATITTDSVNKTYTVTGGTAAADGDNDIVPPSEADYQLIFKITATDTDNRNYFANGANNQDWTANGSVQIGELGATADDSQGMIITNGNSNQDSVFTGKVTGTGILKRTGDGNTTLTFSGDATEYKGNIHLGGNAAYTFTLTFGGQTGAVAATSNNSSTAGVSGTGNITIASGTNKLVYNYSKNTGNTPVYITNAISEGGSINSSVVTLKGGADYVFTKTVSVDKVKLEAGSLTLGAYGNNVTSAIEVSDVAKLYITSSGAAASNNFTLGGDVSGSGTLQVESGATLINNSKAISTALVLNGGNATLKGDRTISGNITINSGSVLTANGDDVLQYNAVAGLAAYSRTITVNAGGELAMGSNRWSIGRGNEGDGNNDAIYHILMAGGKITRGTTANNAGNLDFFDNSKITATGTASETANVISADIRVRDKKTLSLITEESTDSLKISGNVIGDGKLVKSGMGEVYLSGTGNAYTGGTEVTGGKLIVASGSSLGGGNISITNATVEANHTSNNGTSVFAAGKEISINEGGTLKLIGHDMLGWGDSAPGKILLEGTSSADADLAKLEFDDTGVATLATKIEMKGHTLVSGDDINTLGTTFTASGKNNKISVDNILVRKTLKIDVKEKDDELTISSTLKNHGDANQDYNITKDGNGTLVLSGTNTYTGGTTVIAGILEAQGGAALGNGNVTIQGGSVQIEHEDATLTVEKITDGTNAVIEKSSQYKHSGGDSIRFLAAKITVSSEEALSISNQLINGSGLINNGIGTVTAVNGYNNLAHIEAKKGDINLNWIVQYQKNVSALIIEKDRTVGAYKTAQTINTRQDMATLTVQGSASFAENSTLNANLKLMSGTTVTLDDALDMGGSLTLESGLTLQGLKLDELGKLAPGSGEVILFSGVDTLELGGVKYNVGEKVLTAANGVKLSDYFKNDSIDDQYYIGFNANGDVYAGLIVPEPTTATLSLLALAGLCARRRRK